MRDMKRAEVILVGGGIPAEMGGNPSGAGPQSPDTSAAQDTVGSLVVGFVVGVAGGIWDAI